MIHIKIFDTHCDTVYAIHEQGIGFDNNKTHISQKQINKFVVTENDANMSDSEIKDILEEHTNDLTIFIRRDYDICPDCGEEVYYLNQNSTCPSCRRDRLTIAGHMMVD